MSLPARCRDKRDRLKTEEMSDAWLKGDTATKCQPVGKEFKTVGNSVPVKKRFCRCFQILQMFPDSVDFSRFFRCFQIM